MFKRFSAGFAVGYVLGAKAGEKRYKQIAELGEKVLEVPAISTLQDRASEVFTAENGRQVLQVIKERTPLGDLAALADTDGDEEGPSDGQAPRRRSSRSHSPKSRSHRVRDLAHSALERGRTD